MMKVEISYVSKVTLWPLFFSVWVGLTAYVVPITFFATTDNMAYLSNWTKAAVAMYGAYSTTTVLVQTAYYMHLYWPTSSSLCFRKASDPTKYSVVNFDRYNALLTWNTIIFRTLAVLFLIIAGCMSIHTIYPSVSQIHSTYDICDPKVASGPYVGTVDPQVVPYDPTKLAGSTFSTLARHSICAYMLTEYSTVTTGNSYAGVDTASATSTGVPFENGNGNNFTSFYVPGSLPSTNVILSNCYAMVVNPANNQTEVKLVGKEDEYRAICDAPSNAGVRQMGCFCLTAGITSTSTYGPELETSTFDNDHYDIIGVFANSLDHSVVIADASLGVVAKFFAPQAIAWANNTVAGLPTSLVFPPELLWNTAKYPKRNLKASRELAAPSIGPKTHGVVKGVKN